MEAEQGRGLGVHKDARKCVGARQAQIDMNPLQLNPAMSSRARLNISNSSCSARLHPRVTVQLHCSHRPRRTAGDHPDKRRRGGCDTGFCYNTRAVPHSTSITGNPWHATHHQDV